MTHSWTEVQALATKAASGAAVPPAQALAFGAMLTRHLADGGAEGPIVAALQAPETIVTLALRIERVIEAASLGVVPVSVIEEEPGQRALLISWLSGLPCQTDLKMKGDVIVASVTLSAPSQRTRPDRIRLSPVLETQMQDLAARTFVPDSDSSRASGAGTGAGQMELD